MGQLELIEHKFPNWTTSCGCSYGVMAKVLDCSSSVCEFEPQSHC